MHQAASVVTVLLCFIAGWRSGGAQEVPLADEEKACLFQQALRLIPEDRLPAAYRGRAGETPPVRCATFVRERIRRSLGQFEPAQQQILSTLFARPTLPLSVVTASGRFRIHYAVDGGDAVPGDDADGNGLPDFVDEVEKAFERSHDAMVNQFGYLAPPDDGGVDGPEYDIYIHNLHGIYGLTTSEGTVPETPRDDRRSYVEIDNDFLDDHFTPGVRGAQVTAAHEYFHSIQFGYRLFRTNHEPFYYELCSVWMEDVLYDDINDYYQYLPTYFRRTDVSFNRFDPHLHYLGEAIWNHYLLKKLQDLDLFRRTWEIMESNVLAMDAISQVLFEAGTTFADAFAEFGVWNYFTGGRADSVRFYDEAGAYPEIRLNGDFAIRADTTVVDSSLSATHRYYKFTVFESDGYLLTGSSDEPQNWKCGLVVTPPSGTASFHVFDLSQGQNLGLLPRFTEIVVIPANVEVVDGPRLSQLTSKQSRFTLNLLRVPPGSSEVQGITAIYPNPFILGEHSRLNVEFIPQATDEVEIRILTSTGRVIKTDRLLNGTGALTTRGFIWDGTDSDAHPVAAGIYIVQLKQGGFVQARKVAVLRR